MWLEELIKHIWRKKNVFYYGVLIPLSWLFALIIMLRRLAYKTGLLQSFSLPVPVIVVGNINTGGNGKTPAVIYLVEQLKKNGYTPGVISRGYGGSVNRVAQVNSNSLPSLVGDEPVLIASRTASPVWVGKDRVNAGLALLKANPQCNVIVSDDGLQHYRLQRDVEIAVASTQNLHTPAKLLPAGNLREPFSRLNNVDAIVFNGPKMLESHIQMELVGKQFYNLLDPSLLATAVYFKRKSITAMAGIGNPARFFDNLSQLGLNFASLSFDDHYVYTADDLAKIDCDVLLMTEKDAVKCKPFAKAHYWVLPVEAKIDAKLMTLILRKLDNLKDK